MQVKTNNLKNCKFIKTILMLLVILGHACAFWSGEWFTGNPVRSSYGLKILNMWLSSFDIFAFTLVSGYIFAYKVIGGGYDHYTSFLKNKAKRLLVPYWFVMIIWVAPISAYFFKWDMAYLFKKYFLCIDPSQLWFLWMLFGVFALVWPMRKRMMETPIFGWGISVVFYALGIVGSELLPNIFCIWTTFEYVVFFYLGMKIRFEEENGRKSIADLLPFWGWVLIDLALFASVVYVEQQSGTIWTILSIGLNFLLNAVGAVMAWVILQRLAELVNWGGNRGFSTLASYSMPMYLFHQQIIYIAIALLNGKVNPWIHAGINFIAAVVVSLIISSILMKWKTTRFLIGEA